MTKLLYIAAVALLGLTPLAPMSSEQTTIRVSMILVMEPNTSFPLVAKHYPTPTL